MRLISKHLKFVSSMASIVLALSTAGLTGCASSGDRYRTENQYKNDQDIAQNVQDALERAPVYKYPDVHVTAYQGHVQLSGFVATQAQKDEASRIAQGVQGVTRIDNNLLLKQQPRQPEVSQTGQGGNGNQSDDNK